MLNLYSKKLLLDNRNKGSFVAVANGSNIGAYSKDGKNWKQCTLPQSATWADVTYKNGRFIVCSSEYYVTKTEGAYSDDKGKTWIYTTLPATTQGKVLSSAGGKFFIVEGRNFLDTNSRGHIWWSEDGITWTSCGNFSDIYTPVDICYGNSVYVLSATNPAICYKSSDGKSWSKSATSFYNYTDVGAAFIDGYFYAIKPSPSYKSTDGNTWTSYDMTGVVSVVNSNENLVKGLVVGDGIYITRYYNTKSGSALTKYAVSNNLVNWDLLTFPVAPASLTFGNGIFVLVGINTDKTYISKDGRTWTLGGVLPKSQNWSCIHYGKDE